MSVSASSATASESIPHILTMRAPPLMKLAIASESPEFAASTSPNVPPVVFAFEAELRTSACGMAGPARAYSPFAAAMY